MQLALGMGQDQLPDVPDGWAFTLVDNEADFRSLIRFIRLATDVVVDTETTGLYAWRGHRIAGVSIGIEHSCWYVPFRHGGATNMPISHLDELLRNLHGRQLTFHNAKFDIKMMAADGMVVPHPGLIRDTMLAAYVMNENEPSFKLENLAARYIDPAAHDGEQWLNRLLIDHSLDKGQMWKLDAEQVMFYACCDVMLTSQLAGFYKPHLKEWGLYDIWLEVCRYAMVFAKAEMRGVLVDLDMCRSRMESAAVAMADLEGRLHELAGYKANVRSSKPMQALVGVPSTAKDILREIAPINVAADLLLKHRSFDKAVGSYYKPYIEKSDECGVLRPDNWIHGTVTTRISCKNPNLMAIPRRGEADEGQVRGVKDVFIARPGYYLVQADYSQAEIRLGAHYTGDENMIRILSSEDADIHTETAEELSISRQDGKTLNFSVIYGIGAATLSERLGISEERARAYLDKYHKKRPGFRLLYKDCERTATDRGYIRLWTGRVRRYNVPEAEPHKAMSNLIQGGVAEIIRHAMLRLASLIEGEDTHMLLQVHDSVVFEVPIQDMDRMVPSIESAMTDFNFSVPMKVDIHYGKTLGKLTEWT